MSSLWTPEGEHKVERPAPAPTPAPASGGPGAPGGSDAAGRGNEVPSERYDEPAGVDQAEIDEIRQQLLDAPVEVVVANHAYGLFELAALHLSVQPPELDKARLAVDALGALVEGLSGRLGNVEQPLMDALAQIRLAYVQISASRDSDGQQSA
ncbi:MAG: hypothetical protein ACLP6E_01960 [Acidimicrobiales bacterium]